MMGPITCNPIGTIFSEHGTPEETPIQPAFARGCTGRLEIFPEYEAGLKDIETFSHLILLYHLHRAGEPQLTVKPFLDDTPRGVFATRHPARPNRIGLSVVRLVRREGRVLHLEDVDILDGTPLIDVKPYMPSFDTPRTPVAGGPTRSIRRRHGKGAGESLTTVMNSGNTTGDGKHLREE